VRHPNRRIHLTLTCLALLTLVLTSCTPDPREEVIDALLTLSTSTYRMDVTTMLVDGTTQKSIMEFIPPDAKHITDESTGMEYIVVDQVVYVKTDAEAGWVRTQVPAEIYLGDTEQTAESISEGINEVERLGADTLDGKPMTVYQYNSITETSGVRLQNQTEMWVGDEDGRLYKMFINGEVLATSQDQASGEFTYAAQPAQTTTLITYDPEISITAPVP
jgi:hypothetical protein